MKTKRQLTVFKCRNFFRSSISITYIPKLINEIFNHPGKLLQHISLKSFVLFFVWHTGETIQRFYDIQSHNNINIMDINYGLKFYKQKKLVSAFNDLYQWKLNF